MYMRAVTYRIVYFGVLSVGILFGATLRHSAVQAAPATAAPALAVAAPRPPVTLATIHVRATVPPHVRAFAPAPEPVAFVRVVADETGPGTSSGAATLPSLRLDMPYYAFGKLLPRVGKE